MRKIQRILKIGEIKLVALPREFSEKLGDYVLIEEKDGWILIRGVESR